ncbi:MAG: hypothetical protein QG608_2051 [Actinomycetota bacterium]|nr:hypothetical protein [Actinomycetota bacterium]
MVPLAAAQPTGEERLIGDEELFFSTTDSQGVIRSVNASFALVSRYEPSELIGCPHNILRHPAMPRGAFKLLWDRLLSGRPMACYVVNLAEDGAYYWVFTTITPLDDGYLAVRIRPRSRHFQDIVRVYAEVRAVEQEAERAGAGNRAAAGLGAAALESRVRGLGFADFGQFITEALPAEMAAHTARQTRAGDSVGAAAGFGEILAAVDALDERFTDLVGLLDTYQSLARSLSASSASVLQASHQLRRAVAAARTGSAEQAGQAQVLRTVAEAMSRPADQTVETLTQLTEKLDRLGPAIAALRYRIALARLHDDMVATLVCDMADVGHDPADPAEPEGPLSEIGQLCDALGAGIDEMTRAMEAVNRELTSSATLIAKAAEQLTDFRRFLAKWRLLVVRHGRTRELDPYVGPIDEQLANGYDQLEGLQDLSRHCLKGITTLDAGSMHRQLARMRAAVRA